MQQLIFHEPLNVTQIRAYIRMYVTQCRIPGSVPNMVSIFPTT